MTWLWWADSILGVLVLIRMLCIIDHMGPTTSHWVRVGAVALAVAALAVAARPLYLPGPPEWPTVFLHAALAAWLWTDRRQSGGISRWWNLVRHGG